VEERDRRDVAEVGAHEVPLLAGKEILRSIQGELVNLLIAIGGFGGLVVLLSAIIVIGRGIFRQVSATEENTTAVLDLTRGVSEIKAMMQNHETRIAILEDRVKR
jgi:hypothetical protein